MKLSLALSAVAVSLGMLLMPAAAQAQTPAVDRLVDSATNRISSIVAKAIRSGERSFAAAERRLDILSENDDVDFDRIEALVERTVTQLEKLVERTELQIDRTVSSTQTRLERLAARDEDLELEVEDAVANLEESAEGSKEELAESFDESIGSLESYLEAEDDFEDDGDFDDDDDSGDDD